MLGKGVSAGTFFCSSHWSSGEELHIACLKNLNPTLHAMPNLDQIHALITHYGPTVFFHPDEVYLPSSVSWFFKNCAREVSWLVRPLMLEAQICRVVGQMTGSLG
uniref:Putative Vacuolar sorting-associated protein 62 n=1 Tax=Davidia involucrata TaxID=16924 RepID=A0A5B6Z812_DAVIN